MVDLTEENEALAALIKRVEDKVAAAGYVPGVCVEDDRRTYKILRIEVLVDGDEFDWRPIVKVWSGHGGYWTEDLSWYPTSNVTIVPNPEEKDT